MARKVFTSFHYAPDNWRASQVRNMGQIEGNPIATTNNWEEVTRGGNKAIETWIDNNMYGKSCVIVLVGSETAGRKWIDYEIKKAWNDGRALLGIYIHKLKDINGYQSSKGSNPFSGFNVDGKSLSNIVKCYDSPYYDSKDTYNYIWNNIENWIEEAIKIRSNY
ncbi:TIR domain-containing protein [Flavobacterium sp. NG2]|uniref:TIR domain-containing protein n=1 Tax=Flavobacterium sp. NG2 TaxID=3097547 RepID=UPI002A806589|nr:TIR domain-containing protein [Flavobacterium sp. NG2]WPR71571.1 TIR domain-containing protein [Flavobacterium sp. NG2]